LPEKPTWLITQRADRHLGILDMTIGTPMGLVLPMVAAKFLVTSVTFHRQKIQLMAAFFTAMLTKFWKLHINGEM
jgi:hypothetical protein